MKVILPMARIENAYKRSVDYNPMTEIVGKPIIGHLIEQVTVLKPEELIFVVAHYEKEIIDYVKQHCKIPFRFIKQKVVKGSAHAIYGAKGFVKGEVSILFSDTLFDAESSQNLRSKNCDGIIWVSEVSDPRPLGVVFVTGEYVSKLIEKPDEPISNLAMIGYYTFKDAEQLFSSIDYLLKNSIKTKGEYHLTDAIQHMINSGAKIRMQKTTKWVDVDSEGGLLRTLDLLSGRANKVLGKIVNSVIIPPVFIAKGSTVTNSIIGPSVSIGSQCTISHSSLERCIVESGSTVDNAHLTNSFVRKKASVKGHSHRVDVAEESQTLVN